MADTSIKLKTTGMHCGSCAMMIQMTLEDMPGVKSARAEYATGIADVTFDGDVVDAEALVAAVKAAGYGAEVA